MSETFTGVDGTVTGVDRTVNEATRTVTAAAPAKVNCALRVGAPRPDGFHPLDTVFCALDLYDTVSATPAPSLSLSISGIRFEGDTTSNLVIEVARALMALREGHAAKPAEAVAARHLASEPPVALTIHKRIPVAGGMAGGSADAAAALVALNELWGMNLSSDDLAIIGADLGSDIPFSLLGGVARGRGRGEQLESIPTARTVTWVVVLGLGHLSTPACFRAFDEACAGEQRGASGQPGAEERGANEQQSAATHTPASTDDVATWWATAPTDGHIPHDLFINDLTAPALTLRPDLAEVMEGITAEGATPLLSGSGPTIVAAVSTPQAGHNLAQRLSERFPDQQFLVVGSPARGAHLLPLDK